MKWYVGFLIGLLNLFFSVAMTPKEGMGIEFQGQIFVWPSLLLAAIFFAIGFILIYKDLKHETR